MRDKGHLNLRYRDTRNGHYAYVGVLNERLYACSSAGTAVLADVVGSRYGIRIAVGSAYELEYHSVALAAYRVKRSYDTGNRCGSRFLLFLVLYLGNHGLRRLSGDLNGHKLASGHSGTYVVRGFGVEGYEQVILLDVAVLYGNVYLAGFDELCGYKVLVDDGGADGILK